jgi:hypothetical protein
MVVFIGYLGSKDTFYDVFLCDKSCRGILRQILYGRWAPQHAFHIIGRSLRLVSVYAAYQYLISQGVSISVFLFVCLLGSSALFLTLQQPWRGRPLPSSQVCTLVF